MTPGISQDTIIGVSCAILVLLFLLQPLGISKLASCFAPIVIVWLLLNFCYGIYVSHAVVTNESELIMSEPGHV